MTDNKKRQFRGEDSLRFERVTRQMLPQFLEARGFKGVTSLPEHQGQTIVATSPVGEPLSMRVRLCWRRDTVKRKVRGYSAAQLLATIKDGDWVGTLRRKIEREESHGVTHLLLVQREDAEIKFAALIPLSEVVPIWIDQRDTSERLIEEGRLGRRTKNHAMNGSSPTIWLQDDRGGQEVADALWGHTGVSNLAILPLIELTHLGDHEADNQEQDETTGFEPHDNDLRRLIQKQIRERRGQRQFRDALCKRYEGRCLVTGCEILSVLEGAHISPYRGECDNEPANGLLLRADIHTLFDLDLLGIEPKNLTVRLHKKIKGDPYYSQFDSHALTCADDRRPSLKALEKRFDQFQGSCNSEP